jgi:hypothetical protein
MKEGIRFIERHFTANPSWKKLIVESNLPQSLDPLKEISKNLWWTWNSKARELFEYIDAELWENLHITL